ncbi:hypothetical protein I317_03965 [Kwoniella heveanensis CBS 569]|nr:hypothetical protein I317_03965 [Kwoniella heveanensis CBS 569]
MQVAGRLTSAWLLIRERLSHRNLLIFLILHAVTSTILFILSVLSVETNADASHFLRHLIDTANLSGVVFINPHNGKRGNWRSAAALVIESENGKWHNDEGMVCDDGGKKCKYLGEAKNLDQQNAMYNGSTRTGVEDSSSSSVSSKPATSTMTTTMVSGSVVVTTRILVVPTLTVIQGEAITTEVMLNEQGSLMTATPSITIGKKVSAALPISSTSAAITGTPISANPPGGSAGARMNEDGEEEEDDDDDSEDGSDGSDDSEEDDEKEKAILNKVDRSDFIRSWRRGIEMSAVGREGRDQEMGVNVTGLSKTGPVFISQECAVHFGWSINSLDNLVREEIVLGAFFMWTLGLAVVALLNESIPHLMALLVSLVISTMWTANSIRVTFKFWSNFTSMLDRNCGGANILPEYLDKRVGFQSTVLGVNVLTLIASAVLCWKLRDRFGWQTFQRIGASSQMNRLYKLVLALSILLQIDAFVLVTFFALFLDQISRGPASYFMRNCTFFQIVYSVLIGGWTSIRKEQRRWFNIFLGLTSVLIAGWAISFANRVFRVVFTTWAFFTALGCLAIALTVLSIVLAIIRRVTFGKGLSEFLYLEEIHERPTEGFDEKPAMAVQVTTNALPTFSAAFGLGPAPPPVSQQQL